MKWRQQKKLRQQKQKTGNIRKKVIALVLVAVMLMQPEVVPAKKVYRISNESLTLKKGKSYKLKLVNVPAKAKKKIKWKTSNQYAVSVKNGKVKALKYGTAVITATYKKTNYICSVTVPDTSKDITANAYSVTIMEGETFQLTATSAKKVYYHSQNGQIAKVNSKGLITGINPGTTSIILKSKRSWVECVVTVTANPANLVTDVTDTQNEINASNPQLNTNSVVLLGSNVGEERQQYISFSGLSDSSVVQWTLPSTSRLTATTYRTKIALSGDTPESGVIQAQVDGKTYNIPYTVYNPTFMQPSSFIIRGKTTKIGISDIGSLKPTYRSRNKTIAVVTADGKVTGKNSGVTYIDAKVGSYTFSFRIEVAAKGMKKIVNRANYIVNHWKYSQAKRMKRKYYDCSSLVWKGYKSYKKYHRKLGSRTYALTAAGLFDYLNSKKKIVYYGYLGYDYLKPGDLIFYGDYDYAVQYSTPGRTLDIYHVSMYAGNGMVVEKGGQYISYNNLSHVVGIGRVVN